jgi:hypothetical protein
MGAFSKQSSHVSSSTAALGGSSGGVLSMLTPLLNQNRGRSIVDGVTSMVGRVVKPS